MLFKLIEKGKRRRGGSLPFKRIKRGGCADHCPLQGLKGEGVWIIALYKGKKGDEGGSLPFKLGKRAKRIVRGGVILVL